MYHVIDYLSIVVLYKSVNVNFELGQRRRQLIYINPPLSISERKHERSTLAQCFPNVGPASKTMDQR